MLEHLNTVICIFHIFYPWRIPTLKNLYLKTVYPWRIPSSKLFIPEEFHAQNPSPMTNSKLKTLYPWGGGGGTDIKWNSPLWLNSRVRLLNVYSWYINCFVKLIITITKWTLCFLEFMSRQVVQWICIDFQWIDKHAFFIFHHVSQTSFVVSMAIDILYIH
jgi:hypothetical protein